MVTRILSCVKLHAPTALAHHPMMRWIRTHQHETDTTGSPDPDVRQLLQKGFWVAHQPWLKWAEVLQKPGGATTALGVSGSAGTALGGHDENIVLFRRQRWCRLAYLAPEQRCRKKVQHNTQQQHTGPAPDPSYPQFSASCRYGSVGLARQCPEQGVDLGHRPGPHRRSSQRTPTANPTPT